MIKRPVYFTAVSGSLVAGMIFTQMIIFPVMNLVSLAVNLGITPERCGCRLWKKRSLSKCTEYLHEVYTCKYVVFSIEM